jgi:putative tryptophan/tyrosine transport system substrate-binding protein
MPVTESFVSDTLAAAAALGKQVEVLNASTGRDIDAVFARLAQAVDALLVGPAVLFTTRRVQLVTLAAYHRVPAIYTFREAAEAGGLMSYGTSFAEPTAKPAATPAGFSRARSPPTYRSCSRPSSSS